MSAGTVTPDSPQPSSTHELASDGSGPSKHEVPADEVLKTSDEDASANSSEGSAFEVIQALDAAENGASGPGKLQGGISDRLDDEEESLSGSERSDSGQSENVDSIKADEIKEDKGQGREEAEPSGSELKSTPGEHSQPIGDGAASAATLTSTADLDVDESLWAYMAAAEKYSKSLDLIREVYAVKLQMISRDGGESEATAGKLVISGGKEALDVPEALTEIKRLVEGCQKSIQTVGLPRQDPAVQKNIAEHFQGADRFFKGCVVTAEKIGKKIRLTGTEHEIKICMGMLGEMWGARTSEEEEDAVEQEQVIRVL